MTILYPKPPSDPSIPQWWVFSLEINRRLKSLSMLWRLGLFAIYFQRNAVVADGWMSSYPPEIQYARPSRFYVIRLNNPDKLHPGNTAKILRAICIDCGMEYPCPANLDFDGKCDCTIVRKTSVVLWWNRNKPLRWPERMYKNTHEFIL